MKKYVGITLVVFALFSCVQKRVWQGKYTTVSYTSIEPKEDFKVGKYVVVSSTPQNYDKKTNVIYRFDIMENNELVRMIDFTECVLLLTEKPLPNKQDKDKDYNYALMEVAQKDFGAMKTSLLIEGTTYKLYERWHKYDEIKREVIDVLKGLELLPEAK